MHTRNPLLADPVPIIVDGTSIATRTLKPVGPVAGEVVLCHGTPWSSQVWGTVAAALSCDYRVYLWDMPGYGDSEKGTTVATDLRTQAERLVSLMEIWGVQRPHVAAHDIGGTVALRAHLLHGVEFSDLFLWDIVALDPWGSPFFELVAENSPIFAQLPTNIHTALVKEYIAGAAGHGGTVTDTDMLADPWLDTIGQAAFYQQIASLDRSDTRVVAQQLDAIRCPVRIGWGRDDPWIPLHQAYELQSRIPNDPDVVVLDQIGHLAPYENPSAVTDALREWITQPHPATAGRH